jgi:hypothetical protein
MSVGRDFSGAAATHEDDSRRTTVANHPVRLRIVSYLRQRDVESVSPSRLAELWPDVSLGVISHHMRRL